MAPTLWALNFSMISAIMLSLLLIFYFLTFYSKNLSPSFSPKPAKNWKW